MQCNVLICTLKIYDCNYAYLDSFTLTATTHRTKAIGNLMTSKRVKEAIRPNTQF